ncbi:MAG: type II toxin-antitoxin system PemK/MazF family toxin [Cyanobacteria bacterium J06643_13]
MSSPAYRQLEIRWIDLEPTRGAETRKRCDPASPSGARERAPRQKRPCIIIQSNLINQGSRTIIVAPILPGHKDWPFVVNVKPSKNNGLDKERHINLKQMRAVDISRIQNRQGILERQYLKPIQEAIEIIFAL